MIRSEYVIPNRATWMQQELLSETKEAIRHIDDTEIMKIHKATIELYVADYFYDFPLRSRNEVFNSGPDSGVIIIERIKFNIFNKSYAIQNAKANLLQSVVTYGGVGVVATDFYVALSWLDAQSALAFVAAANHVFNSRRVIVVVDHVGAVEDILSDTSRLKYLKDYAGVTPRCEVD